MITNNPHMSPARRFWRSVVLGNPDDCWLWTGRRISGYGVLNVAGKPTRAHRFAYEMLVGPIPADRHIDHLCRVRKCVNPRHMEPVSLAENVLRGEGVTAQNARKTECKRGHPLDGLAKGTGSRDRRYCKTCQRDYMRRRRAEVTAA